MNRYKILELTDLPKSVLEIVKEIDVVPNFQMEIDTNIYAIHINEDEDCSIQIIRCDNYGAWLLHPTENNDKLLSELSKFIHKKVEN